MKKLARVLYFGFLFFIVSMIVFINCFNGDYIIPAIIFNFIFLAILSRYVKKRADEIKATEQIERLNSSFTPEFKEYYYSKSLSTGLFVCYIFMPLGFTYAVTIPGQSILYHVFMIICAGLCYFFLYLVIFKWMLPAYRNEPAFSIDRNCIDLKNGYTAIKWNEIETIIIRQGVIGIKLIDLDDFIDNQPVKKKKMGLKFYKSFYGYHFGISLIIIRNDNTNVFETMDDYFKMQKNNFNPVPH